MLLVIIYLDIIESKKPKDTPHTRARRLLRFCRSDLTQLTDQALGELQSEWMEFQGDMRTGNHPPVRNRLVQWQQEVRGKLNELQNGQRWSLDCRLWRQLEFVDGQLDAQAKTYPQSTGAESKLLVRVVDTLEAVAHDLRLCKRDKCRKLFVRTKRQVYCSGRCRGTEGTQRYRKNLTNKLPSGTA